MIEDKQVTLDGKSFRWSHDPCVRSPQDSWTWVDTKTDMMPPGGRIDHLNRAFIDQCAADVAATLDDESEDYRFCLILKAMGASDEEIRDFGLKKALLAAHLEKAPSRLGSAEWADKSPLHILGYQVGQKGKDAHTRHQILRQAFTDQLPEVKLRDYMAQWGEPGSPMRLKKIADNIATSCRNRKRKGKP